MERWNEFCQPHDNSGSVFRGRPRCFVTRIKTMQLIDLPQIKTLLPYLKTALSIESILCYGSYAAGLQDEKSDLELLILL